MAAPAPPYDGLSVGPGVKHTRLLRLLPGDNYVGGRLPNCRRAACAGGSC